MPDALIRLLRLILLGPASIALITILAAAVVAAAGPLALGRGHAETRALLKTNAAILLAFALFAPIDWGLLALLPALRISFASDLRLPLAANLFIRLLFTWALLGATTAAAWRQQLANRSIRSALTFFLAVNLLLSSVQVYAYMVEPMWIETTEHTLTFDDLDPNLPPVRVVQIADLHIERNSRREAAVLERVNELQPDLIVLTGDYLNLSYLDDPTSVEHFRHFASQLHAPYGVYAVRGNMDSARDMPRLMEGTGIVWLEQEATTVHVRGQAITLVGVPCRHRSEGDEAQLREAMAGIEADAFVLLLYHSPDLIAEAAELPVDLYLAGHTHGGQIRLPLIGPLVTYSRYGRRYAAGLFTEGNTVMYVSRGIGLEGGGMPRARFLCRPEVAVFELGGR